MTKPLHEAADIPLDERVAYASVVAAMAAADTDFAPSERERLEELCEALALPEPETAQVIAAAEQPSDEAALQAVVSLKRSFLRFTLYADCLMIAYADDEVVPAEEAALTELAGALDIGEEQAKALRAFVEAAREAARENADEAACAAGGKEVYAKLERAGVPTRSLALISAAGLGVVVSSVGLAALATALGLSGPVGAVLGLGVGTMLGVRWLHRKLVSSPD